MIQNLEDRERMTGVLYWACEEDSAFHNIEQIIVNMKHILVSLCLTVLVGNI